jgi:hypothetical protein
VFEKINPALDKKEKKRSEYKEKLQKVANKKVYCDPVFPRIAIVLVSMKKISQILATTK